MLDLIANFSLFILLNFFNIVSNFPILGVYPLEILEFRLRFKDLVIEFLKLFHILFLLLSTLSLQVSNVRVDFLDIVVAFLGGFFGLADLV